MIWNYIYNFIYQFINTNDSTSLHHIYICLKINQRYEKKITKRTKHSAFGVHMYTTITPTSIKRTCI